MIIIEDKKIISFFDRNPEINPETLFSIMIDLYEYFTKINSNNEEQIIPYIVRQTNDIHALMDKINSIKKNSEKGFNIIEKQLERNISYIEKKINILNEDITNNFVKIKNEYLNEIKNLLKENNMINNNDIKIDITKKLIENNNFLVNSVKENIHILLPELINKLQINSTMKHFENNLLNEVKNLINNLESNNDMKEYIKRFEKSFDNYFLEVLKLFQDNKPLSNLSKIYEEQLKEILDVTQKSYLSIINTKNNFDTFIDKFNNSAKKGNSYENLLESILNNAFPTSEVINTTKDINKGDFILNFENKCKILIETKDYKKNINKDEINKFIRDTKNNNCSGVFLSQNSGIVDKENFQIDIFDNRFHIYLHNVNYDINIIKLSIQAISHLSLCISNTNLNKKEIFIDNEDLSKLKTSYENFLKDKQILISNIKKNHKQVLESINSFDFTSLSDILSRHFPFKNKFFCDKCDYEGYTLKSVNIHKRIHKELK